MGAAPVFVGAAPVFVGEAPVFVGAAPVFVGATPVFVGATPVFVGQPLSLWEQHPVRDLLVDHQPHRARGAAPTGDRGSAADDAAELGAGIDAEFAENGAHMGVHRAGRDAQANGDFFVGVAAGDEFEHVGLAL